MELTLRKASKIRSKVDVRINELAATLRNTNVNVDIQDTDQEEILNKAAAEFESNLARFTVLVGVRGAVRKAIGDANRINGIDFALNKLNADKMFLGQIQNLVSIDPRLSPEKVETRLATARKNAERNVNRYGGEDQLALSFVSNETVSKIEAQIKDVKKEIENLTESLEGINASSKITLTDDVVEILRKEELI